VSGSSEGRAVPYFCPFCASEDLWPAGETHGQWECRACARAFALRFVGLVEATARTPLPRTAHRTADTSGGTS